MSRPPEKRRFPSLALSPEKESRWRDYECSHGREVLLDEIEAIARDSEGTERGVTQAELELRAGELDATIERARFGELVEGSELKAVAADPELWEIRLRINDKPVRIYHAEPQGYENLMVGLRAHFKWVRGSQGEIWRRQNVEISVAVRRYNDGASREWYSKEPAPGGCPPDEAC